MIKVAVVEDHQLYRNALVTLLRESDMFSLTGAYSSAEEAVPALLERQPDVAIIDIQLPLMSGIMLIQKLKPSMPHTQFMVCTLHKDNLRIVEALKAGASGYMLKDDSADDIADAIKELFMGGSPMSPYIARKVINMFQASAPDPGLSELSSREVEVLSLISNGLLYKEIALKLFISSNTVKNHLKNIYKKLHVQNKTEAINKYHTRTTF